MFFLSFAFKIFDGLLAASLIANKFFFTFGCMAVVKKNKNKDPL
jgi:hypothetical protein